MADNKINVGGRLHSIATGNVLAGANEILDDSKNKKQSEINTETYSLVNDVNERLSGLSPDQQAALSVAAKATNNETKLGYYVCDTEGDLAAKVISNATGYILSKGGSMKVKMTNANTANNVTLNINSTGAKALYYDGERASAINSWEAGETVEVYYDGTSFYANSVAGGSGSGDGAFDVSVKYPTSGVEGGNTYTLEGALAVLNANLPASKKKGGMSIKFVQSSDNKYMQYRLMSDTFNTTPANWQGVDDKPTAGSDNLVKSGGIVPTKLKADNITEELNLFWGANTVINGVSFTFNENGLSIVGTSTAEIKLPLRGAISINKSTLPADTYTANLSFYSGNTTNDISLRYGASPVSTGSRWVNNSTKTETVTFAEETTVILYVSTNKTYNITLQIQINKGSEADEWTSDSLSAKDVVARANNITLDEKIDETASTLSNSIDDVEENAESRVEKDVFNMVTEDVTNLFWGKSNTINGVTAKFTDNGLVLNGTASANGKIPLWGAGNIDDSILPAGTYTAEYSKINVGANVTLRYGSGTGTRWVNSTNPKVSQTFDSDTIVFVAFDKNSVFDNTTYHIQIVKGSYVGAWEPGGLTAIDKIARSKIADVQEYNDNLLCSLIGISAEKGTFEYGRINAEDGSLNREVTNSVMMSRIDVVDNYILKVLDDAVRVTVVGYDSTSGSAYQHFNGNSMVIEQVSAINKDMYPVIAISIEYKDMRTIAVEDIEGMAEKFTLSNFNIDDTDASEELRHSLLKNGLVEHLSHCRTVGCLTFALITDTHCTSETATWRVSNNIKLFSEACKYVDFGVHCGDVVLSTGKTREQAIAEYSIIKDNIKDNSIPLYIAKGNHDLNARYPSAADFNYDVDNSQFIMNPEFDAITRGRKKHVVYNPNEPFGAYYYVDYEISKVRVIVLNTYKDSHADASKIYGDEQIRWIAEVALNFTEKTDRADWSTVVFSHTLDDSNVIRVLLKDFMDGVEYASLSIADTSYFATQGSMNLIGSIQGHHHDDVYHNNTGFNEILVDRSFVDMQNPDVQNGYILSGIGNKYEYCVSLFAIDNVNHRLYETRLGRIGYAKNVEPGDPYYPGRYGYVVLPEDPNTGVEKVNRSFSYGKQTSDQKILTGIDDNNKNT